MRQNIMKVLWVTALTVLVGSAGAAPLPADDNERSCWLSHTQERTRANLKELTDRKSTRLNSSHG